MSTQFLSVSSFQFRLGFLSERDLLHFAFCNENEERGDGYLVFIEIKCPSLKVWVLFMAI